jgi:nucleotide-binding universal stress UspA family protein
MSAPTSSPPQRPLVPRGSADPSRPRRRHADLVVRACAVPGWARRWAAGSGRAVQAVPDGAPLLASDAGTLVLPGAGTEPVARPRVVAVLRDLDDDLPVLAEAADVAAHLDGCLRVLHGVPLSFGERSVGIDQALRRGRLLLADARTWLEASGCLVPVSTELVRAWPHELVDERLAADLLTVGAPRRDSGARIGLVTSSAIHHAPCPVLLAARTVDQPGPVGDGPAPEDGVPVAAP